MLEIRVATLDEIDQFLTFHVPVNTVAKIAYLDGEPIGMGGLTWTGIGAMLWLEIRPVAKRYKVALHRCALELIRAAFEAGEPKIVAFQNPNEPKADQWMMRLGFREAPTVIAGLRMFVMEARDGA